MTTPAHTQHIKVRSMQLEMPTRAAAAADQGEYEDQIKAAEEELARIQSQREELARKKREIEELTARKRMFLTQQSELFEKLTAAVTLINRELETIRRETEDLEQCRVCFAAHLDRIQKINPESWTTENLAERLDRANMVIDIAGDEYDQAAAHFEHSRCGGIFGRASSSGRRLAGAGRGEFLRNLRNGLAFNLPLCALGTAALVIYLLR